MQKLLSRLINKLQINAAKNTYNQTSSDKAPFNYILKSILKEEKIWNTNELLDAYRNKDGTESNSTHPVKRIQQHLKDEIYCFKAPGAATVIMHKEKASI